MGYPMTALEETTLATLRASIPDIETHLAGIQAALTAQNKLLERIANAMEHRSETH